MAERGNGRHARQRKGPRRAAIALMAVAAVLAVAAIAWYLSMLAGLIPTAGLATVCWTGS